MAEIGDSAIVTGIYMSPAMGEPMASYDAVGAAKGRGLYSLEDPTVEDRYAAELGSWSKKPPKSGGGSREISLFPWEGLEEALEAARDAVGDPDLTVEELALLTRRNIGVRGFGPDLTHLQDHELVDEETGLRIKITNDCDPCDRPGRLAAKLAIPRSGIDLRELLPGGRAGMRARTMENGIFVVGHTLEIA